MVFHRMGSATGRADDDAAAGHGAAAPADSPGAAQVTDPAVEARRRRGEETIGRPAPSRPEIAPAELMQDSVARALAAEQLANARRVNFIRFTGVSFFFALFALLGTVLEMRAWQGNLHLFLPYWVVTGILYVAGRRHSRIARLAGWSIALLDMPMVLVLQWATFQSTPNAAAVAGYTMGVYVLLVLIEALSLDPRRIYVAAMIGGCCEALLLAFARVDVGAIVSSFVIMGIAAVSCVHGTRRVTALIRRIAVDLSERRRVEEAVRARDEFLSVASHELKTPLTSLQLNVESLARLMRRRDPTGAASNGLLARIDAADASTLRLGRLIDHLLDVSRIRSGQLDLALETVELGRLAGAVIEQLADGLAKAGCKVELDASAPAEGQWDRLRVEQVVTNLLTNAMKYGASKPIVVTVGATATHAELTVRDQGIGIKQADLARIFDRFERAVSARNFGGLGLGLWISARIVTAHGGTIQVDSTLGEGATFKVTLPRTPPSGINRASLRSV